MTQEEFDKTAFGFGMLADYKGKTFAIAQVDFEERLIGIVGEVEVADEDDDITWKRCENIEQVHYEHEND